jgi:hypothetical protein
MVRTSGIEKMYLLQPLETAERISSISLILGSRKRLVSLVTFRLFSLPLDELVGQLELQTRSEDSP